MRVPKSINFTCVFISDPLIGTLKYNILVRLKHDINSS